MEKEGKMFKTWRKRYFTLDDQGKLSYSHNKGDENSIGTVDITKMIKTERTSFGRHRQYGVQLHTNDRVWKFLCLPNDVRSVLIILVISTVPIELSSPLLWKYD